MVFFPPCSSRRSVARAALQWRLARSFYFFYLLLIFSFFFHLQFTFNIILH